MSVTIGVRTLVSFATGVAVAVIALVVFQAVTADAAPGDEDATFVPITACRLMDTRPAPDRVGTFGAFGADETKTISAHGSNGQCSLPTDAVGLVLNVTAVNATAPTFLTIWGDGARPTASALNPAPAQPPTPNAVTVELAGNGTFKIYNRAGTVQVIVDVTGYYTNTSLTDLHERLQALETAGVDASVLARLEALEGKTASMSVLTGPNTGQPTVRFSNVNVQVVSGSGNTDAAVNGRGNLIVGYNEPAQNGSSLDKRGSHNLVIGPFNGYTNSGGLVAGRDNTVSNSGASVTGGQSNVASGRYSSISGGVSNRALGVRASVSGGAHNVAFGPVSSILGGAVNRAEGSNASVSGGTNNKATGTYASVSGGDGNTAGPDPDNPDCSANAAASSVSGGLGNHACDNHTSILGGANNTNEGARDTIIGGDDVECAVGPDGACGEFSSQGAEWKTAD